MSPDPVFRHDDHHPVHVFSLVETLNCILKWIRVLILFADVMITVLCVCILFSRDATTGDQIKRVVTLIKITDFIVMQVSSSSVLLNESHHDQLKCPHEYIVKYRCYCSRTDIQVSFLFSFTRFWILKVLNAFSNAANFITSTHLLPSESTQSSIA